MTIRVLQFLILALSPLYIIRLTIPFLNLPITFLEILIWVYFGIIFVKFAREDLPWNKLVSNFNWPIGLFLIAAMISVLVSPDKWGGLGIFRAYFLEPTIFYYTILYTSSQKTVKTIFFGLLTAAIWLSLMGLLQKITGQFSLAEHEIAQGRISAVYNSANSLALFIGPIIFLTIGFFFSLKKNNQVIKFLLILLTIFFSVIIVWTKSRGGLVAETLTFAIFGFGLMALKYQIFRRLWFLVPVILTLLIIFFFYTMFQIYGHSTSFILEDNTFGDTLGIRYNLWVGTINLLISHPIFGAGLNGFKDLYAANYRLSVNQEQLQYPHNIILNFWSETGLLGLISFIWLQVLIFRNFLSAFLKNNQRIFGLGIICAFVFLILQGLVDVPYFKNDLSLEFWAILGIFELWLQEKQLI